jgi:hypothetical protein
VKTFIVLKNKLFSDAVYSCDVYEVWLLSASTRCVALTDVTGSFTKFRNLFIRVKLLSVT